MEAVASRIGQLQPGLPVRCAYLELIAPTLEEAAAELVSEGVEQVTVAPMFLGSGKHVRDDLPALLDRLRQLHGDVEFKLQMPVGEDPRVVDLLAAIALE